MTGRQVFIFNFLQTSLILLAVHDPAPNGGEYLIMMICVSTEATQSHPQIELSWLSPLGNPLSAQRVSP